MSFGCVDGRRGAGHINDVEAAGEVPKREAAVFGGAAPEGAALDFGRHSHSLDVLQFAFFHLIKGYLNN